MFSTNLLIVTIDPSILLLAQELETVPKPLALSKYYMLLLIYQALGEIIASHIFVLAL